MSAKVMKAADPSSVPEALRNLHQNMVSELNRHLRPGSDDGTGHNTTAALAADISGYIGRIQKAGNLLQVSAKRIRELEDALYNARSQHAELTAQLQEANASRAELEQALAAETERAQEAEARAIAAEETVDRLQQALATTNGKLDALTSTIDGAFGGFAESPAPARNAA